MKTLGALLLVVGLFMMGWTYRHFMPFGPVELIWADSAMQIQRAQLAAIIKMACETPEFVASDYRGTCRFTREEIMRGYLPMPILLPGKTP